MSWVDLCKLVDLQLPWFPTATFVSFSFNLWAGRAVESKLWWARVQGLLVTIHHPVEFLFCGEWTAASYTEQLHFLHSIFWPHNAFFPNLVNIAPCARSLPVVLIHWWCLRSTCCVHHWWDSTLHRSWILPSPVVTTWAHPIPCYNFSPSHLWNELVCSVAVITY